MQEVCPVIRNDLVQVGDEFVETVRHRDRAGGVPALGKKDQAKVVQRFLPIRDSPSA
jgi:hypothetical protein